LGPEESEQPARNAAQRVRTATDRLRIGVIERGFEGPR
jgi:hypothetical protein